MPTPIGRTPASIGREETIKLKRVVLAHFADWPKAIPVMQYLFERAINGQSGYVSYLDLIEIKGAPKNENAVKNLVSRLRKGLMTFFSLAPEGRSQRWKVAFPKRGYAILFEKNEPPALKTAPTAFLDGLWSPYALSKIPIQVLYPECQLYRVVSEKPEVGSENGGEKQLHAGSLERQYSFVATGVMQALLRLLDYFGQKRIPTGHGSLHSMHTLPEPDQDLIVLAGLGTASRTIARLAATLPMALFQPEAAPITRMRGKDMERERSVCNVQVVLTRRPHRINGRALTILSGEHGGAIEALARLITDEAQVKAIAGELKCGSIFPEYFQVLFIAPILLEDPDSLVGPLALAKATPL